MRKEIALLNGQVAEVTNLYAEAKHDQREIALNGGGVYTGDYFLERLDPDYYVISERAQAASPHFFSQVESVSTPLSHNKKWKVDTNPIDPQTN